MFLIPDTGFQVTLSKTRQVCEFSKMSVGKVTVVVLLEKEGLTLLRRWQCLNWWITKVTRTWRWLWILDIFLQGKGISYHMLWRWYSIQRNLYLQLSTYFRDLIRKKLQVSHTKFECWNKREHPLTINLLILWYNSKVERPTKHQSRYMAFSQISIQTQRMSLGSVRVDFMYHLDWAKACPDCWGNINSGCVHGSVPRRDYHLNQ